MLTVFANTQTRSETKKDSKVGFFSLSGELRNEIYHLAFLEVNYSIKIEGKSVASLIEQEPVEDHTNDLTTITKSTKETDKPQSPLALLATCKQISAEASGIAYSKMSLSLEKLPSFGPGPSNSLEKAQHVRSLLEKFTKVFPMEKIEHVRHLILHDGPLLDQLIDHDTFMRVDEYLKNRRLRLDLAVQLSGGPLRDAFKFVTKITVVVENDQRRRSCDRLDGRAPWLSLFVHESRLLVLLETFASLKTVVVRRSECQQTVKIVGQLDRADEWLCWYWKTDGRRAKWLRNGL
ncbi:hypothetical protein Q7P37_005863 [Cladosporium fusiforme]